MRSTSSKPFTFQITKHLQELGNYMMMEFPSLNSYITACTEVTQLNHYYFYREPEKAGKSRLLSLHTHHSTEYFHVCLYE